MRNRGMDGVGMAKTLCFPDHPDEYAYRIMVKGTLQVDVEKRLAEQWQAQGKNFTQDELRHEARSLVLSQRIDLIGKIKIVFLDPYFDYAGETDPTDCRERYKSNAARKTVGPSVISSEARNLSIQEFEEDPKLYKNRFLPSVGMTPFTKEEEEQDYRNFGYPNSDPGDIFRFFVRVKSDVLCNYIENDLLRLGRPRFLEHLFPEVTLENYKKIKPF